MSNRILMRIDLQNDFVHPRGNLTINNPELIARHQKFARNLQAGMFDLIIDSYDTHFAETYGNTEEARHFPPHCIYGSKGWQSAAPFKNNIEVVKIFKSTTNIWHEKKTYPLLSADWQDKEVFLCGVLSDICVVQAMDGLLKRGAGVTLLEDLCCGANRQISEIVENDVYRSFIESGRLGIQTSAQLFRATLLQKKLECRSRD